MPRLTAKTAAARRQRIVAAALGEFARHGFDKTTMSDVCRAAGLSPGAVYCWFESKEDIAIAVARERHARERALIEAAFRTKKKPRAALEAFVDAYFDWLASPGEKKRRRVNVEIWSKALHDRRLHRAVVDEGIGQRRLALPLVRRGRNGRHRDVHDDTLARILIALIQGIVLQQAWEPDLDLEPFRRAVHAIVATFIE